MMNFIKANGLPAFCLCLFMIAAESCSLFDNDRNVVTNKEDMYSGKEDLYNGIYTQGFEDSWFEPCISVDESWNPLFTDSTFKPVSEILRDTTSNKLFNDVFIRARGYPARKENT